MPATAAPDRDPSRAERLTLLGAGLFSLWLVPSRGTEDVLLWRYWTDKLLELGLRAGYASAPDSYPPGSAALLLLLARVARFLGASRFIVLKLSLWLGLLALTAIAWRWTKSVRFAAGLHLALLLNSAALGYLDVYFGVPMLLGLLALRAERHAWAGLCYGLACSFKWQPLIAGPGLLLYLAFGGAPGGLAQGVRRTLSFGMSALLPLAVGFAIFGSDLTASVAHAMSHPYLSGNALNLAWIGQAAMRLFSPASFGPLSMADGVLGNEAWLVATLDPRIVLPFRGLFLSAFSWSLVLFLRSRRGFADFLATALLGSLAYFVLNTGVHENHSFLSLLLAAALAFETDWGRWWFVLWATAANLNLWLFYGLTGEPSGFSRHLGGEASLLLAAGTVVLFVLTLRAVRQSVGEAPAAR